MSPRIGSFLKSLRDEKEKTYTVTMKAVEKGCSISKQQKVYLQPNPVANFELDEYKVNCSKSKR